MPLSGDYAPSSSQWVADQIATYERTGGREGNTQLGLAIIVVTCRGARSRDIRKFALMRVEHDGEYALVASNGGAERHPGWFHNLMTEPHVEIQDGPAPNDYVTEVLTGTERQVWWDRCIEVFSRYAEYQDATDRVIPVFVARHAAVAAVATCSSIA